MLQAIYSKGGIMDISSILWINNPIEHRKVDRLNSEYHYAEMKKQHEEAGNFFIDVLVDTPIPDDLWVCDLCNAEIDITISIPVIEGYAMCRQCYTKLEEKITDNTYQEDCSRMCCIKE